MRRTTIAALFAAALALSVNAQTVPTKIKRFLDTDYPGWKQAGGACGGGKWLLTADFNGDGRTDYLVRIFTGAGGGRNLHLIGFINERGEYRPDAFLDEEYKGDVMRTATNVMRAGTQVDALTEGGQTTTLKHDAVNQYICETDAAKMFVFSSGQFVAYEPTGSLFDRQPVLPKATPDGDLPKSRLPTDVRIPPASVVVNPTTGDVPDLTGTYTVYDASGKLDKNTGTVSYPGGKMTFKLSDGRAFSTATAYSKNGLITTGWGRNATVSADGRTIIWTNGTKWVRK